MIQNDALLGIIHCLFQNRSFFFRRRSGNDQYHSAGSRRTRLDPRTEYARIITISQITPGPIAVNTATYVGARVCGPEFWHALLGSFVATFSVSLPSFILVAIVARSLQKFNSSLAVQGILNGLRPSVIALMLTAVFFFMRITFFPAAGTAAMENLLTYFKFWPTLLTALLFYLHYYRNLSAIPLMLLAGCAGLLM